MVAIDLLEKEDFGDSFLLPVTATNSRPGLLFITYSSDAAQFSTHGMKKTRVTVARMKWTGKSIGFHLGIPFQLASLLVPSLCLLLLWLRFMQDRSMNPPRKKIVVKKEKERNHSVLCIESTRAGDTLTALTEPLIETPRLQPEARAPAALVQAHGVYTAALLKSQENSLSRRDCGICSSVICSENFAFKEGRRGLMKTCTKADGVQDFLVPFLQLWFRCVVLKALRNLQYFITWEHSAHGPTVTCEWERVSLCVSSKSGRHSVWKMAFMRKPQICHVANKWTYSSSLSLSLPLSQKHTHTHTGIK